MTIERYAIIKKIETKIAFVKCGILELQFLLKFN